MRTLASFLLLECTSKGMQAAKLLQQNCYLTGVRDVKP